MFLRTFACTILSVILAVLPAHGLELVPFQTRNLSPVALIHGLAGAEAARQHQQHRFSTRLGLDLASNATLNNSANEVVLLDGESYVTTLGVRYGVSDQLQLGFDLPWVAHRSGSLDGFVRDWHDLFGLPNGDRDVLADDQLTYAYANIDGDQLLLDHETSGVGDIRLLAAWQLLADDEMAVSLFTSIKAPTGDSGDLTGSEAWDVAVALSAQRDFQLDTGSAAVWGGFGGNWLGDGDVLQNRVEEGVANAWLGVGWSPLDWLGLKLQLDSHSALYESDLDELGNPALILTMGGTLAFGQRTSLELGVGEDLAVNASPDVSFHLGLSHQF